MADKYIPLRAKSGKTYLCDWWNAVVEANFINIFSAFSKHIAGTGDRHKFSDIDCSDVDYVILDSGSATENI